MNQGKGVGLVFNFFSFVYLRVHWLSNSFFHFLMDTGGTIKKKQSSHENGTEAFCQSFGLLIIICVK